VPRTDRTADARKVLAAVRDSGGYFGMMVPLKMLCGKVASNQQWLRNTPSFDTGEGRVPAYYRCIGEQLLREGYLIEAHRDSSRGGYMAVQLGESGHAALGDEDAVIMLEGADAPARDARDSRDDETAREADPSLLEQLKRLRADLAADKPLFTVASNATLQYIAAHRPTTPDALLHVPGIGARKAALYGERILACVASGAGTCNPGPSRSTLLRLRRRIAVRRRVSPYMLLSEAAIQAISSTAIGSHDQLSELVPAAVARELWEELIKEESAPHSPPPDSLVEE